MSFGTQTIYLSSFLGGRNWLRTCSSLGLEIIFLNNFSSAVWTFFANVVSLSGRYFILINFRCCLSRFSLSFVVVSPHQAGEAYSKRDINVASVTLCITWD